MSTKKSFKEPKASRPHMPGYGLPKETKGLLPWKWAEQRLTKSRQYWIATTRPDSSPHVMLVWGLWLGNTFYFSTGGKTRKSRNLAVNPHCVVCSQNSEEAVIVEGTAEIADATGTTEPIYIAYQKKYKIDIRGMKEPIYRVRPCIAFGLFEKKFANTATRWRFAKS